MQQSIVKWFDAKKGYGFIDHPEGGDDIFVHYSQIVSEKDFKTLRTGQQVTFELNDGPKGLHALDVKQLAAEGEASEDASQAQAPAEPSEAPPASSSEAAPSQTAQTASSSEDSEEAPEETSEEASEEASEDEWESEWDEEEWTDEHGNPPDPMAGPSF